MNILISQKNKKIKYVHSSWNFLQQASKHKIHLGTLKKTSGKKKSLDKIFLKSKKKIDFINFRRVLLLMEKKEHLTPEGLKKIRKLREKKF